MRAELPAEPQTEGEKDERVYELLDQIRDQRSQEHRAESRREADLMACQGLEAQRARLRHEIDEGRRSAGQAMADALLQELQRDHDQLMARIHALCGSMEAETSAMQEIARLRVIPLDIATLGVREAFDHHFDRRDVRDQAAELDLPQVVIPNSGPLWLVLGHRFTQKILSALPQRLTDLQGDLDTTTRTVVDARSELQAARQDRDAHLHWWNFKKKRRVRVEVAETELARAQDEVQASLSFIRLYQSILPVVQRYAGGGR